MQMIRARSSIIKPTPVQRRRIVGRQSCGEGCAPWETCSVLGSVVSFGNREPEQTQLVTLDLFARDFDTNSLPLSRWNFFPINKSCSSFLDMPSVPSTHERVFGSLAISEAAAMAVAGS